MKNRTFAQFSGRPARPRRRGRTRLFVLGAAFVATGTVMPKTLMAAQKSAAEQKTNVQQGSNAPASTADRRMPFAIPSESLESVLSDFTRVTGLTPVVADQGILVIQSPGVRGTFTAAQAMERLLMGTAVNATFGADGAVKLDVRGVSEFVEVNGAAPQPSSPKYTEPLRDTPATVVVIPQAVFQEQAATSLRDALRNTPGITLTAGEGGTAPGDNLIIRGFSARNDVYIDGARDPGVVSRDTFNVEAVEVAKGPSSVVAGRGSTGGSVNLVTKTANLENSAAMRLSGGAADYKRATLDTNLKLSDAAALRLNAMVQHAGVPRRDAVRQEGWGVAPSLALGLGTPTQVTLNYQHLQQNNVPDYGLPGTLPDAAIAAGRTITDLDFSNFYGLIGRDHEKIKSEVATATVSHRFSRTLSLRNLTRYGQNDLDRIVTPPRAASAANGGADPGYNASVAQIRRTDTKYQYRNDRTLTNQTDLTARVSTGPVNHSIVTGIEIARDRQPSYAITDAFSNGRPPVTDLFNPNPGDSYAPSLVRTGASSDARALSGAAYAFDTMKLSDQWQLDVSGRWDRINVDYSTVAATGALAAFSRTDSAPSGRAGVVYKPVERGSVYAAYSTSFNPSFDGSFGLTLAATGANNAALPPEKSRNAEVGTKWDVSSGLFVTAALFRTEKTNAKTTDAAGATVLAGDQQVTGVEVGVSGSVTPRWSVFSGLSLMDGSVQESGVATEVGRQLSYVPKTSFNLWSTYRLPFHDLTLGGGAQFTDGYFFTNTNALTSSNAAAIQSLTKYWLFNGVAIYQVNRHVSLQVNAMNLANARYVERGYTGHFIPGPGRAVMVSPIIAF